MARKKRYSFARGEEGSFTIEASLVFPVIMLCTVSLLFLGIYVYQNVYVNQISRTAAEDLAYTWDNSHKDLTTGNFLPGENDGLYWRLTQDSAFDLFGMLFAQVPTEIALPVQASNDEGAVERKLAKSTGLLPAGMSGTARYTNYLLDRQVQVTLTKPFQLPSFVARLWNSEHADGDAVSHVVEPVELMRITDITRTYIQTIKDKISPQKAKEALVEPVTGSLSGPGITIRSERQAAAYLRSLVGGTEKVLTTPSGDSRTIDALDAGGVAHQAFYTFTEAQLRSEQLPKDAELLEAGTEVKGVVWHFFKKDAKGTGVPSDKLRKELERKGIVVVIHQ